MRIKRTVVMPALVAVVGLASGGWLLQQGVRPASNVYYQARLLEEVVDYVNDHFVEETDRDQLYQMAIDGMLDELGDPHSVFMTPEDWAGLRMQTSGEYGGLGIEIDIRDGWLTVISPLVNSPAERVGLQAGDRIIRVDGESTREWTTDEAVSELRGPEGSTVSIVVARRGIEEPIPFEITRADIEITAVPAAHMLDGGVGYVELTVFSESATDSLRHAVDRLLDEGATSLVLDMRRNTGGLLDQGMSIADLFLDRRQLVLETRGRTPEQNQVFRAARPDQYEDLEMAVLIGRQSASATEIVAGALQDHDRAVLIGETSFGKGSVQSLYELPGQNILKLTTARWYTPSGRSIQKPYGIGASAMAVHDEMGVDLEPEEARPIDEKTEDDVPVYRTDSGREVLGGGGITPDLIVRDTLSSAEQDLVQAIQDAWPQFQNLLYRFAVDYAHQHPDLRPGFSVTDGILDQFYGLLEGEGMGIDRDVYDAAAPLFVGRRLANEISIALFSRSEGLRRLLEHDPQVSTALDLLRAASTTDELFALLSDYADRNGFTLGSEAQTAALSDAAAHPF